MLALLCFAAVFLFLWGVTYVFLPALLGAVRRLAARLAIRLRAHARFAPWLGRIEPWRMYLPLVLAFAIGTAVVFAAAHAFVDIAAALKEQSPAVQAVDAGVYAWFGARRTPGATLLFRSVTTAGGAAGMSVLVLGVLAVLLARRRFRRAAYLTLTAAGGALLNQLLKFHYVRQRPDLKAAVLGAMGYSFPSGHAMSGTIILAALAYLVARASGRWKPKSAVISALVTLAVAIGVSRLYLGVHWASDVGAGFAAGALWIGATTTGYEVFRQYRLGQKLRERFRAQTAGGAEGRPPV
jgi:undecaprenyl-diphosphatase